MSAACRSPNPSADYWTSECVWERARTRAPLFTLYCSSHRCWFRVHNGQTAALLLMMRERRNFILICLPRLCSSHDLLYTAPFYRTQCDSFSHGRQIHAGASVSRARQNRRCFVCAHTQWGFRPESTWFARSHWNFMRKRRHAANLFLLRCGSLFYNSTLIGARLSVKLHIYAALSFFSFSSFDERSAERFLQHSSAELSDAKRNAS